ncbi:competence protein ComEC [Eubacterium oxidoreducens]|uniref:Competence protein ComEC n=1 Tax=Eubacterium oxidoreducens TaxID=1732 RepID=A0A1G6B5T4_EUBOX|nr:competence protein ComEC [Eubacterium oxidoreducens]
MESYLLAVILVLYCCPQIILGGCFAVGIQILWMRKHSVHISRLMGIIMVTVFCFGAINCISKKNSMQTEQLNMLQDKWCTLAGKIVDIQTKEDETIYLVRHATLLYAKEKIRISGIYAYQQQVLKEETGKVGDWIVLKGYYKMPQKAMNEGGFDAASYYRSKQIDGFLFQAVCVKKKAVSAPIRQNLYALRERLDRVFLNLLPKAYASLAQGMILGEKQNVDEDMKALYADAGIAHLLAISGLHVSMVGNVLRRGLKRMRLKGIWADAISFVFVVCYIVMTGGSPTAIRAGIMYGIMLLGPRLNEAYDLLTALAISAFVELVYNPYMLASSSFLYSYMAIFGIIILGKPLVENYKNSFKRKKGRMQKCKDVFIEGLLVSASIQVMLLPLQMYTYYEVSLFGTLLNVLVLPLSGYLIGDLFVAAIGGMFWIPVGRTLAIVGEGIFWLYEWLCKGSLEIPGSTIVTGQPKLSTVVIIYICIFGVGILIRKSKIRQMVLLAACYFLCSLGSVQKVPEFEMDVLYVGQGDGIFLRTDKKHTIFIDGGSTSDQELGERTLFPFFKAKKITKINYWFVSHGDEDHISGLKYAITNGYRIEHLVVARLQKNQEAIKKLTQLAGAYGIPVVYMSQGQSFQWDRTRITALYPGEDADVSDANAACLGLKIDVGEFSGLFLGDLGTCEEEEIARQYDLSNIDFYKVDHHGSKYSNSEVLLSEMNPKLACVSYGEKNRYGHPHKEALLRIAQYSKKIHKTAVDGQLKIVY